MRRRLLPFALLLVGCPSGEGGTPPNENLSRLEILPGDTTVMVGVNVALRLRGVDAKGGTVALNPAEISWTALDPEAATVTSAGVVLTQGVGAGRIVGTVQGLTDTVRFDVRMRVVQIPLPPGKSFVEVYGVNDRGMVVGAAYQGLPSAFIWTAAGGTRLLTNLPSTAQSFSQARAVNEAGTITGYSYDGTAYRLVTWTENSSAAALSTPALFRTIGTGINERGQIAVWAPADGPVTRPEIIRYDAPGQYSDLPSIASAVPRAIGADGAIVGSVGAQAMIWRPGGTIEFLPVPPGNSFGEAIDAGDRVAGWYAATGSTFLGFLWSPTGGRQDLPTLGGSSSLAYGMNDAGVVVGESDVSGNERHAFRWTAAGGMVDLLPAAGTTSAAVAVSRSGIIAGVYRPTQQPPFLPRAGLPTVWFSRRDQLPASLLPP